MEWIYRLGKRKKSLQFYACLTGSQSAEMIFNIFDAK